MTQPTVSSKDLASQWLDYQRQRAQNPELYRPRSTGLKSLDKILGGGIEPGQYVVVGGAQKSGKTTLLSCMTEALAKQGLKVLFLSGEMTTIQMANMFFSRLSRIDRTRIRAINLDNEDWVRLERAAEKFSKYNIWWNHGFSSVTDIDKIVTEMEVANDIVFDAIIVDYIQLMEAPEIKSAGNRSTEIEYISRSFKRRTLSGGKPKIIIVAAQLNRASIRSNLYDANAFLNSGSLERDMDIGIMIKPVVDPILNTESKNKRTISVVGSRETGISDCEVYYNGIIATMQDLDTELEEKDMRGRF